MSIVSVPQYLAMNEQSYGAWLKHQRQLRGITQEDLERSAELSNKYVSKVENGRLKLPTPEVRQRVHEVLGTSDDDLVNAGVLRRLTFGGRNPVYLPSDILDDDSEDDDAYPWEESGVRPSVVMEAIRSEAMNVIWSQSMLDAITSQIEAFRQLQEGRYNLETLGDRKVDLMLEEDDGK